MSRRQFVEAHRKIVQGAAIDLGRLRFRIRPARESTTNSFFYVQYLPESCFCSSFLFLCVLYVKRSNELKRKNDKLTITPVNL